jgi:hypothetical protein
LSGVDLSVKNAYFQSDGTLVTSVGLRLIDSYAFFEGNRYAWFTWSPTMAQLIENGELRALDTDFYFRIDDFLARRLFRHLNIFGKPGRTTYTFAEIVKTRLGLEPSTEYVSKCKDPVERACRELVRHGFLESYAIEGRFVNEATITIEMPADYQPSENFSLPFEAIIDSFRKDAEEAAEPVARGGLWRQQTSRLDRLTNRSTKAKEAATELSRLVYEKFGPSADALSHAIDAIEELSKCGIRLHTAVPEAVRLVDSGAITPSGLDPRVGEVVAWWARKRQRGESVGPGLLVSALRDPSIVRGEAAPAPVETSEPAARVEDAEVPDPSPEAAARWGPVFDALRERLGVAATRDWLRPVVPVAVAAKAGGKRELTLWVPNATFVAFLSGETEIARALRAEASRAGVERVAFATNA